MRAGILLVALVVAACDGRQPTAPNGVIQTRSPGEVAAGGGTSGQVMQRSGGPKPDAEAHGGTPGIPEGSGGNTSGADLGGTGQAKTPSDKKPEAQVAKEKEQLAASIDKVSAHWKGEAARQGWKIQPAASVTVMVPDVGAAPLTPRAMDAADTPFKSEKLGTAPPSEDLKQGPTRREPSGTPPTFNAKDAPSDVKQ